MNRISKHVPADAWPGLALLSAAIVAMLLANSPLASVQAEWLESVGRIRFRSFEIALPLATWVENLLMAVFFFLVGLELKRELRMGALSSPAIALQPVIAATAGVICPALIYLAFNHNSGFSHGWAIPTATDIAFAVGAVSLLGKRVAPELKIFLLAIAVVDDLIAVVIIALFYSDQLHLGWLGVAALCYLPMLVLMRQRRNWHGAYMLLAMPMWIAMQQSGINPTIAGVLAAFAIPLYGRDGRSLLMDLENRLRPYVEYGVLPLFALAVAGTSFHGGFTQTLSHPVGLGIALGLFLGKPIGIVAGTLVGCALLRARPPGALPALVGIGFVAGIGFTMSLFVSRLAFASPEIDAVTKLGIYGGSALSAVVGLAILAAHSRPAD